MASDAKAFLRITSACLLALLIAASADTYAARASDTRPILVVTAVDNEFIGMRADLSHPKDEVLGGRQVAVGRVEGAPVVLIRTGWGKAHAAGATAAAIVRFKPRIVIMAGTAGSLDPQSVMTGDVVVVDATFQYDLGKFDQTQLTLWPPENPVEQAYGNKNFLADESALNRVSDALGALQFTPWILRKGCECGRDGRLKPGCTGESYRIDRDHPRVCAGTTTTGDSFDMDKAAAVQLVSKRDAVGVDMETAAVAEEAADFHLPFIGIRVITDVVGQSGGVNLYYCLKPLSGARLGMVMKRVIGALSSHAAGGASAPITKCKTTEASK